METLLVTTEKQYFLKTMEPSVEQLRVFHERCAFPLAELFRTVRAKRELRFRFVFRNCNKEVLCRGSIDLDGKEVALSTEGEYDFSGGQAVHNFHSYNFDQEFPVRMEMEYPEGRWRYSYVYTGNDEAVRRKWCEEYGTQVRDEFYEELNGLFIDI